MSKRQYILFIVILLFFGGISVDAQDMPEEVKIVRESSRLADLGQYKDAISYLQSNKSKFLDNEDETFWWNYCMGTYLYLMNDLNSASSQFELCIQTCEKNPQNLLQSGNVAIFQIYYWVSNCYYRLGQREKAISALHKAREVYEKYNIKNETYNMICNDISYFDDRTDQAESFLSEGTLCASVGRTSEAIELYKKALANLDVKSYQNSIIHAQIIQGLCYEYIKIGDYAEGENICVSEINRLDSVNANDEKIYRMLCDALAVVYNARHSYVKASEYSMRAKMLFEKNLDFDAEYVRCLSNCALIQYSLGHDLWAKLFVDVALNYARKFLRAPSSQMIQTAKNYIQNKPDADTTAIGRSVKISTQINPMITLLSNASMIYFKAGCRSDAISAIKEAIALTDEYDIDNALVINNLAMLYLADSKYKAAYTYFKAAFQKVKNSYEFDEIGPNIVLTSYLAGSAKDANMYANSVSVRFRNDLYNNLFSMSSSERSDFWNHFQTYLPILNCILFNNGTSQDAGNVYDNILTYKGLLLNTTNQIHKLIEHNGSSMDVNLYGEILNLREENVSESDADKRQEREREIESLEKSLIQKLPSYGAIKSKLKVSWTDIRSKLKADEIAIEFTNLPIFVRSDSIQNLDFVTRYCAVVLKHDYDYPHIIPLATENQLDSIPADVYYTSSKIYHAIWKPLAKELAGAKIVYFSPTRYLCNIAIESVADDEGRPISDDKKFIRLSSTRELVRREDNCDRIDKKFALYGGIEYSLDRDSMIAENNKSLAAQTLRDIDHETASRGTLDDISGETKVEIEDIGAIMASSNVKYQLFEGSKASETSFKSLSGTGVNVIHLSTHGFYFENIGDTKWHLPTATNSMAENNALFRCGLLFAGAKGSLLGDELPENVDDGILTGAEIENLQFDSLNLVVMSACQTGLGEVHPIEGVFGLQRAFKLAGANAILMSLWDVDNEATQLLMTEFYRHYLNGEGKQSALKAAQLYLRNYKEMDYSSPKYWAAFVLLDALD